MAEVPEPTQLDKFKALARELKADEDEAGWDERLKKVVAHQLKEGDDAADVVE